MRLANIIRGRWRAGLACNVTKHFATFASRAAPICIMTEGPPVLQPEAPTNAPCKYHPRSLARWTCVQCHKTFCDLCVTSRPDLHHDGRAARAPAGSSDQCALQISSAVAGALDLRAMSQNILRPLRHEPPRSAS